MTSGRVSPSRHRCCHSASSPRHAAITRTEPRQRAPSRPAVEPLGTVGNRPREGFPTSQRRGKKTTKKSETECPGKNPGKFTLAIEIRSVTTGSGASSLMAGCSAGPAGSTSRSSPSLDADFNHPLVQLAGDWDSVQVRGHRRVDYWLVANSFGVSWGDLGGFFHIRRGTNECGLESLPTAGLRTVERYID